MTRPLPLPRTLWELVEQRATLTPGAAMLRDESDRRLSFAAFRDAATATAAGLADHGVGAGTVVSWQLPTSIEAFVLMVALARVGAVQNPVIPILRHREVGFIVGQTGASLLVVPGVRRAFDHGALAREVADETGSAVLVLDDAYPEPGLHGLHLPWGDPATLAPPPPPVDPDDALVRWIYYTSGTIAEPKGVRHTDPSVMASSNAFTAAGWFTAEDVAVVPIPATHIGGTMLLTILLRAGCSAVLIEAFDPVGTPRLASEVGMTLLIGNVAVFNAYIAAQQAHGPEPMFPSLKAAGNGGSSRPPEIHGELKAVLGGRGTFSGWGLTECPAPTCSTVDDDDEVLALTEGRPGPEVELSVVGADGRDCPQGVEGELRLKGAQLFRGYVDASLDADALDERGRLRTGDLGIVDERGNVRVTGRIKDIVIRNGENISALEVETVLGAHPSVADVAVIGLPDARTGERCVAVVQPAPGMPPPTLAQLAEHCRGAGLATQKIPEQLELVDLVPRNDLGKLQKQQLRAQFGA